MAETQLLESLVKIAKADIAAEHPRFRFPRFIPPSEKRRGDSPMARYFRAKVAFDDLHKSLKGGLSGIWTQMSLLESEFGGEERVKESVAVVRGFWRVMKKLEHKLVQNPYDEALSASLIERVGQFCSAMSWLESEYGARVVAMANAQLAAPSADMARNRETGNLYSKHLLEKDAAFAEPGMRMPDEDFSKAPSGKERKTFMKLVKAYTRSGKALKQYGDSLIAYEAATEAFRALSSFSRSLPEEGTKPWPKVGGKRAG